MKSIIGIPAPIDANESGRRRLTVLVHRDSLQSVAARRVNLQVDAGSFSLAGGQHSSSRPSER
jgi:hypothetical protein